jgi:hypothetical protein
MTENERKLLFSLAWMCEQYLRTPEGDLDHLCMSAGEDAVELLVAYGLLEPSHRGGHWTKAGKALLDSDIPKPSGAV